MFKHRLGSQLATSPEDSGGRKALITDDPAASHGLSMLAYFRDTLDVYNVGNWRADARDLSAYGAVHVAVNEGYSMIVRPRVPHRDDAAAWEAAWKRGITWVQGHGSNRAERRAWPARDSLALVVGSEDPDTPEAETSWGEGLDLDVVPLGGEITQSAATATAAAMLAALFEQRTARGTDAERWGAARELLLSMGSYEGTKEAWTPERGHGTVYAGEALPVAAGGRPASRPGQAPRSYWPWLAGAAAAATLWKIAS